MNATAVAPTPQKSTNVRIPFAVRVAGATLRLLDVAAPRTATRLAANLFLTPRKLGRPSSEESWARHAEREETTIDGMPVVLWRWGTGPAVLLLHGWEGRGTQLGAFAEPLVKRGYSVIAPDFPAHGDSAGRQTNLLEFAAVVRALIERHDPAAIIAHSFGSAATTVALQDVPYDGSLVYIAPPEDFTFFTRSFARMLNIPSEFAFRMQRLVETRFHVDWSQLRGIVLAQKMTAPLLVIHDDHDADVPPWFGHALVDKWPGARLLRTARLGHRRVLRDESVILAALSFIREAASSKTMRAAAR